MDLHKLNLKINALGRFSMSPWKGTKYEVKNKNIKNLPNWLALKKKQEIIIINYLKKNFKKRNIKKYSVCDVGCNDGYFTEKLSNLGFSKVTGIEPRIETILRGKKIRSLLKIKTKSQYIKGTIDSISKFKHYDIVVCCGVLHHTSSISKSFNKLLSVTKDTLIIEGEFLPKSTLQTRQITKHLQLKDLFYREKDGIYSISINKFETNFLDGSSISNDLVEIPTASKLIMLAKLKNFELKYYKENNFKNILNTTRCVLAFKRKKQQVINFKELNEKEERFFLLTAVPLKILKNINKSKMNYSKYLKFIKIINNLKYSFKDKINFEFAKSYYFLEKNSSMAIKYLEKIIYKKNPDWFSCYRSFALMYLIDKKRNKTWKKFLKSCNPNFPVAILNNNEDTNENKQF
jgi:hypothetical protein